jgi:hypothetical protein
VLEALEPSAYTALRGARLSAFEPAQLHEGDALRIGSVDLIYSEAPLPDAAGALAPSARLSVTAGPDTGKSVRIAEHTLIGSSPSASLVLRTGAPTALEVTPHGRGFFARNLGPPSTLRAGRPLGADWTPLEHGDLLLVDGSALLCFEEI